MCATLAARRPWAARPTVVVGAACGLAGAFEQGASSRGWNSAADGARFGLIIFASLSPATIFSNALRAAALPANDTLGVSATIVLATAAGAATGWIVTRARAGVVAFSASTLALTIAMGGAIPVVNDARAALLFADFLPICIGAGVALTVARRCLTSPEHP